MLATYDSFCDWKINNQFEDDLVERIHIAGLCFDVQRKSRVVDVRLRPATAPALGDDLCLGPATCPVAVGLSPSGRMANLSGLSEKRLLSE